MVPLGLTPSRLLVARLAGGSFLRLELVIADGVLDEDPEEVTGDEVRRRHPLEFVHEGGLAHLIRLLEAQEVADQAFTSIRPQEIFPVHVHTQPENSGVATHLVVDLLVRRFAIPNEVERVSVVHAHPPVTNQSDTVACRRPGLRPVLLTLIV